MAKKAIIAKPKVITIWLVTVKLNGTIPNKLQKKMNENIVKSIGKYSGPFFFTFSAKTLKYMNSNKNSAVDCQANGTSLALANAKL
tara:strand:- start:9908 stop:10165 length:258 start_codon:yes stop_codon:yes gene_type:complete